MWLARQIASPDNPLTARAWVNRLWCQLFGRGIVANPNNLGKLGGGPSHPELLDYLAGRLTVANWSTKSVLREIVLSDTYQRSSESTSEARRLDPNNRWLSHQNRRRLPAELLRDNLLSVAGSLDMTMFGPSMPAYVPPYATANKPSNIPKSGPLDGARRRSVYIEVRRNFHDPFLLTFDFPDRGKSIGRRPVTNVPSQSLAMLNGPFVVGQAKVWGAVVADAPGDEAERIAGMFERAVGRLPNQAEATALENLAGEFREAYRISKQPNGRLWQDIAHTLFNLDEFAVIE